MMISSKSYYEMNLREETAEQIMSASSELKNEIWHIKNVMVHPDYGLEPIDTSINKDEEADNE